ncbi:hypothetical protein COCCADRAFT_87532, partial [Bipolaris zeicola 26-R-13]
SKAPHRVATTITPTGSAPEQLQLSTTADVIHSIRCYHGIYTCIHTWIGLL